MKKFTKVLVLLTMVICLSGCMKMKVEMNVESSTKMTMTMDYLMEEKFLAAANMTNEQFIEKMKESIGDSATGAKITPKTETIDGAKWVGMTISGLIKQSEMKEILSEKEIDKEKCVVLTLEKDFMSGSQFGGMDADKITQQSGYSMDKLKALGMEMSITINMPADAKSNVGKVEGNKVTIDLLELGAKGSTIQKIEISSPLSKGFDMTFILIGVGVVVILGAVFLIMKKKKTPKTEMGGVAPIQEMPQPPVTTNENQQVIEPVQEVTPEVTEEPVQEVTSEVTEEPVQEVAPEVTETTPVEQPIQTNEVIIYCPNCGEKVSADDVFCQKCGFALKK